MVNTAVFSAQAASKLDFWKDLSPEMTIEGEHPVERWNLPQGVSPVSQVSREGYWKQPGIIPTQLTERMYGCVRRLTEAGIPPVYSFVYDEFWLIFMNLAPILENVLGNDYRLMPSLWTWFVPPSDNAGGWMPHRDRSSPRTLRDDLTPNTTVVWLPLTDADELNGCMYVLPAHLDEWFVKRDWANKITGEFTLSGKQLQNIRALPAPAGSVLLWHGLLLHWGGRASGLGTHPRCSISLQFQRGDVAAFDPPLLDPQKLPPFQDRLGFIGDQIITYAKFNSFENPSSLLIAIALKKKFFPN